LARKLLLVCGILSSLLYVGMNVVLPMLYPGYSVSAQTVSELFAIGAPTRPLWDALCFPYAALLGAFAFGLWRSAQTNRALRVAGILMLAHAVLAASWPPIHQRGLGFTLTDVMHNVWVAATVLLFLLAMWFAAGVRGRRFRVYSIGTIATIVVSGGYTWMESPRVAADLPTPWIGVSERIAIAAFLLWVVVVAIALMDIPERARTDYFGLEEDTTASPDLR
jgi:uncharacterized membrane protein